MFFSDCSASRSHARAMLRKRKLVFCVGGVCGNLSAMSRMEPIRRRKLPGCHVRIPYATTHFSRYVFYTFVTQCTMN
jgi:hypothetical protein